MYKKTSIRYSSILEENVKALNGLAFRDGIVELKFKSGRRTVLEKKENEIGLEGYFKSPHSNSTT